MTVYGATIVDSNGENPCFGDHITVQRSVGGLTQAQVITKAWLTVKADLTHADASAALQLEITTTPAAAGQITDDGAGDTEGEVTFTIAGSDYDGFTADVAYHYDIQVLLDDGTVSTLEKGRVTWEAEVTRATS